MKISTQAVPMPAFRPIRIIIDIDDPNEMDAVARVLIFRIAKLSGEPKRLTAHETVELRVCSELKPAFERV